MNYPHYDHIPTIREMLGHDGIPGVEYALVTDHNLFKAQTESWEDISGGSKMMLIRGPKGEVPCKLLARGRPIKGAIMGIVSFLHKDKRIREITGLGEPEPPTPKSEPLRPAARA